MPDGITDIVVRESGRYMPGTIRNTIFGTSPWLSLTSRGTFPGALGETISTLTYERNAPTDAEPTWSDVTVVDGQEGGTCLPAVDNLDFGSTTRSFNLKRRALHGPRFCAEDLRSPFEVTDQLNRIAKAMAERVRIEWEIRDRHEYFRHTMTKVVVDSCNTPTESTTMASTYPAACPTQTLGMGLLEKYAIHLLRNGAANSALLMQNGAPLLTVIASPEWIGNAIRNNADLRSDIRDADSGKGDAARLLKGFGVRYSYGYFMFIADLFPRRFTCTGGVYTEVAAYVQQDATKGHKYEINPAYRSAPYEELFIFDPTVYDQLIPSPITNLGPTFRFDPVNYIGDVKVLNIPHEVDNPDGNIIRHRIIMAAGSKPNNIERGVSFVQLRCDPDCNNATACSS